MSAKRNEVRVEFVEKPFFEKVVSRNGSIIRGSQIVNVNICVKLISAERRFVVRWSGKGENSQQALKDAIQGVINLIGKKDFNGIKFFISNNGCEGQQLNGGINKVCKKLSKKER